MLIQRRRRTSEAAPQPRSRLLLGAGLALVAVAAILVGRVEPLGEATASYWDTLLRQQHARWTTQPERLILDIGHTEVQRLRFQRERALAERIHLPDGDDFLPARIRHGEVSVPIQLRLKGVYADHWEDESKWSLLVKTRGDRTLLGMKRFALLHPRTRDFLFEWLFLRALADEGLIALRFAFVEVVINGENRGIYSLSEHFGKRLIESNRRREGPIVGFNKDGLLREYQRRNRGALPATGVDQAFWSAYVDGVQTSRLPPGSDAERAYLKALALLESFRSGRLRASQVFDVDQLGRALALKALFGATELDWRDLKFYYNPLTALLEPITAEVHHGGSLRTPGWWVADSERPFMQDFLALLFADSAFAEAYANALERVSRPDYVRALVERNAEALRTNLAILTRSFPSYRFSPRALEHNRRQIRAVLEPLRPAHAYLAQAHPGRLILELGNLHPLPVELLGVTGPQGARFAPAERWILPGKRAAELVDYASGELVRRAGEPGPEPATTGLSAHVRVLGTGLVREVPVLRWPHLRSDLLEDPIRAPVELAQWPFLVVDASAARIHVLPGRWRIDRTLVLPAGFQVEAGPGVELVLGEGASLVSYSPLRWVGDAESPIAVEGAGPGSGGIALLRTGRESHLRHVVFRGLSAPVEAGWQLTGAFTAYEAPVRIEHCVFESNRGGDDHVNLVRSAFVIESSRLEASLADALDVDFSQGRLRRVLVRESGNDAIDTSGSQVQLEEIVISGAGDKGLSAGEGSQLRARGLEIAGARVAIAAKDRSTAEVSGLAVRGAELGFAIFRKKPEFGPASLRIARLETLEASREYLVEEGSVLVLGERKIQGAERQVADRLYGR